MGIALYSTMVLSLQSYIHTLEFQKQDQKFCVKGLHLIIQVFMSKHAFPDETLFFSPWNGSITYLDHLGWVSQSNQLNLGPKWLELQKHAFQQSPLWQHKSCVILVHCSDSNKWQEAQHVLQWVPFFFPFLLCPHLSFSMQRVEEKQEQWMKVGGRDGCSPQSASYSYHVTWPLGCIGHSCEPNSATYWLLLLFTWLELKSWTNS